jgi:hypothetical protein
MEQHGGYRQPNNPAPVSGPGALSQRTDGGAIDGMQQPMQQYTGFAYGENKALNDQQAGAPMAETAGMPNAFDILSLDAPTQFPDEPISAGADYGPGPGLDLTGIRGFKAPDPASVIYNMMKNDTSGQLEALYNRINLA